MVWRLSAEAEGQRLFHDADEDPGRPADQRAGHRAFRAWRTNLPTGFCDITTRQTIQYHWLRIEDVPPIFDALEKAGIITSGACGDITRNVGMLPRVSGSIRRQFSMPPRRCWRSAGV